MAHCESEMHFQSQTPLGVASTTMDDDKSDTFKDPGRYDHDGDVEDDEAVSFETGSNIEQELTLDGDVTGLNYVLGESSHGNTDEHIRDLADAPATTSTVAASPNSKLASLLEARAMAEEGLIDGRDFHFLKTSAVEALALGCANQNSLAQPQERQWNTGEYLSERYGASSTSADDHTKQC